MGYLFENKTEYLLHSQREKIAFAKFNLTSQLQAAQKRSISLAHDLIIYLLFVIVPIILSVITLFIAFFGNLILRILFVPLLFVSIGSLLLLMPFGVYKLCMGGLMYLFGRHSGNITFLGKTYSVYTYKMEENYCLGKLQKLEEYERQLNEWEEAMENGEEVPDFHYMENVCDKMELDFKIKVAVMEDPILKRYGKLLFVLLILFLLAVSIGTLSGAYIKASNMMQHNILEHDVLENV